MVGQSVLDPVVDPISVLVREPIPSATPSSPLPAP